MAGPGGALRHARSVALIAALTLVALAGRAGAASPPTPWDGTNPFRCVIQNAGRGTTVPDPAADPYCVAFDKTGQNISELGLVQFLSLEPARAAAATPKCFYFQEDHWRGSLIQSDGSTVLYEFRGHYFFNKATGDGGVWVTGFSLAGHTFDPAALPGFPPSNGAYFSQGTGGMITHDSFPADPGCAAKLAHHPDITSGSAVPHCVSARGKLSGRSVGPLTLGQSEDQARAIAGPPGAIKRGFLHYCVTGGGELLAGETSDRSGSWGPSGGRQPIVILLTTARGYAWHPKLHVGISRRAAMRILRTRRSAGRAGRLRVLRRGRLIAVIDARRVVMIGLYEPRVLRRAKMLTLVRRVL